MVVSRVGSASPGYVVPGTRTRRSLSGRGPARRLLYDMDRDPWQTRDVYATQRALCDGPGAGLCRVRAGAAVAAGGVRRVAGTHARPSRTAGEADEEQRKALQSLGYVD